MQFTNCWTSKVFWEGKLWHLFYRNPKKRLDFTSTKICMCQRFLHFICHRTFITILFIWKFSYLEKIYLPKVQGNKMSCLRHIYKLVQRSYSKLLRPSRTFLDTKILLAAPFSILKA